jgi:hypothetical protein
MFVLADGGTPAVLAAAPAAVMLADGGALAVLAFVSLSVVLADGGAPEVLALAPVAVMLADRGAPTGPSPCTCSLLDSMMLAEEASDAGPQTTTAEHAVVALHRPKELLRSSRDGASPRAPERRSAETSLAATRGAVAGGGSTAGQGRNALGRAAMRVVLSGTQFIQTCRAFI